MARDEKTVGPIPVLNVSYRRIPKTTMTGRRLQLLPGEVRHAGSAITDQNGNSQIVSVPAGDYHFCVNHSNLPVLDPCRWGGKTSVSVEPGGNKALIMTLKKGVFLKVHIADPRGLLTGIKRAPGIPLIHVGVVFGKGATIMADAEIIQGGINFQMPIPENTKFQLWLYSPEFEFLNAKAEVVNASGITLDFVSSPAADSNYLFTISGKKKGL